MGINICTFLRKENGRRTAEVPDWIFSILEQQNPPMDVSELHNIKQSTDFEVLKLRNVQSGSCCCCCRAFTE